jgi:ParB family chromosome partitioning protein
MSPSPIDNLPAGTVAAIFDSLAASRWPRQDKPAIASRYGLTIADLQTLLQRHGVEDLDGMRLLERAHQLRAQEATPAECYPGEAVTAAESAELRAQEPVSRETEETDPGTRQRLVRLRVDQLRADPNNPREHLARDDDEGNSDLDQLADSIRENGLLQPIVVREVQTYVDESPAVAYTIVAGHRRAAALRNLRWTTTEVIIRPPMRPDEVLAAMLIENGQRAGLDPIEEARAIRTLGAQHGWTDAEVARKIGRSQNYVSRRLALLQLDPDEQERIRAGEMGLTAGSDLGRLKSGRTRYSSKGHTSVDYFGPTHDLADRARARCSRLGHKGRKIAGGEACGGCWESVLRADERDDAQTRNANAGRCVTCGQDLEHDHQAIAVGR